MKVFTWLTSADFHLQLFWLQTLVRIMPDIVYKPFLRVSEVSVLFDWNLNRRPFLDQVVDLDLLPDSEHANLFLCLILLRDQ